ncbi:multidrug effflux MFS transporter [Comamonas humi]
MPPSTPPGSPATPRLSILIFLSALAVLPLNMFVPSLPRIAEDLDAGFALANLAVAGYAVATAFAHLAAGALSDRFGRRPVALAALAIFTLASLGCGLAGSIGSFLLFRCLQSVVIAGYAVSLAAIRDTCDERMVAGRIGYLSSAWAVAPMVGPAIGGALDAHFGWRANFFVFAGLGAAALCLAVFGLPETHRHRSSTFARQLRGYAELARSTRFWAYAACMACAIGTLYAFLGGAPLVAAQLGLASGTVLGLYMGLVPAGFMLGSYVVGHASGRCTATGFIVAGRALTGLGLLLGLGLAALGATHPLAFFGPCMAVGLGNGLTMPAANARVLSIHPGLAGTASGLASALTVAGAGLISLLSGLVVQPAHAHGAVLGTMLVASLLSGAAALGIVRAERQLAADAGAQARPTA